MGPPVNIITEEYQGIGRLDPGRYLVKDADKPFEIAVYIADDIIQ